VAVGIAPTLPLSQAFSFAFSFTFALGGFRVGFGDGFRVGFGVGVGNFSPFAFAFALSFSLSFAFSFAFSLGGFRVGFGDGFRVGFGVGNFSPFAFSFALSFAVSFAFVLAFALSLSFAFSLSFALSRSFGGFGVRRLLVVNTSEGSIAWILRLRHSFFFLLFRRTRRSACAPPGHTESVVRQAVLMPPALWLGESRRAVGVLTQRLRSRGCHHPLVAGRHNQNQTQPHFLHRNLLLWVVSNFRVIIEENFLLINQSENQQTNKNSPLI